MDSDFTVRAPRSSPISLSAVNSSLSLPSPIPNLQSSLTSVPMSPTAAQATASRRLDALLREQTLLATMKSSVPHTWSLVDAEISRLRSSYETQRAPPTPKPIPSTRKRIKLRVPAEKYPDYNFVGRLLGPRGATLKKLERDTGCKIMIRGRGSIRKDKESEVRGKPGWEHVFNENLHVVIEVSDFLDDTDANRILTRAREMVELLLVPVPEERDTLKRQQLRDLAILNGTYRSTDPPLATFQPSTRSREFAHANADFDYPPFSTTDSFLARRRAASNSSGNMERVPPPVPSPSSSLSRHGGPVAMAAAAAAAAAAGVDTEDRFSRSKLKTSLPSRSDSYLPDIGALRIPSLDIETMNESFLVSPMVGGLPGPSPTVVDETFYPFPSTPGVRVHDRGTTFGSPIWSGAPASSPLTTGAPLASPPLPSTPARSPPDEGATTHRPSIPPVIQLSDGDDKFNEDVTVPTFTRGRGNPHPRVIDAAAALARDLPTHASVFQSSVSDREDCGLESLFPNGGRGDANAEEADK